LPAAAVAGRIAAQYPASMAANTLKVGTRMAINLYALASSFQWDDRDTGDRRVQSLSPSPVYPSFFISLDSERV
jgi:hypothetical protein